MSLPFYLPPNEWRPYVTKLDHGELPAGTQCLVSREYITSPASDHFPEDSFAGDILARVGDILFRIEGKYYLEGLEYHDRSVVGRLTAQAMMDICAQEDARVFGSLVSMGVEDG